MALFLSGSDSPSAFSMSGSPAAGCCAGSTPLVLLLLVNCSAWMEPVWAPSAPSPAKRAQKEAEGNKALAEKEVLDLMILKAFSSLHDSMTSLSLPKGH